MYLACKTVPPPERNALKAPPPQRASVFPEGGVELLVSMPHAVECIQWDDHQRGWGREKRLNS